MNLKVKTEPSENNSFMDMTANNPGLQNALNQEIGIRGQKTLPDDWDCESLRPVYDFAHGYLGMKYANYCNVTSLDPGAGVGYYFKWTPVRRLSLATDAYPVPPIFHASKNFNDENVLVMSFDSWIHFPDPPIGQSPWQTEPSWAHHVVFQMVQGNGLYNYVLDEQIILNRAAPLDHWKIHHFPPKELFPLYVPEDCSLQVLWQPLDPATGLYIQNGYIGLSSTMTLGCNSIIMWKPKGTPLPR